MLLIELLEKYQANCATPNEQVIEDAVYFTMEKINPLFSQNDLLLLQQVKLGAISNIPEKNLQALQKKLEDTKNILGQAIDEINKKVIPHIQAQTSWADKEKLVWLHLLNQNINTLAEVKKDIHGLLPKTTNSDSSMKNMLEMQRQKLESFLKIYHPISMRANQIIKIINQLDSIDKHYFYTSTIGQQIKREDVFIYADTCRRIVAQLESIDFIKNFSDENDDLKQKSITRTTRSITQFMKTLEKTPEDIKNIEASLDNYLKVKNKDKSITIGKHNKAFDDTLQKTKRIRMPSKTFDLALMTCACVLGLSSLLAVHLAAPILLPVVGLLGIITLGIAYVGKKIIEEKIAKKAENKADATSMLDKQQAQQKSPEDTKPKAPNKQHRGCFSCFGIFKSSHHVKPKDMHATATKTAGCALV